MSNLHDSDTLTWSERQATLLRRIAAGAGAVPQDCPASLDELLGR